MTLLWMWLAACDAPPETEAPAPTTPAGPTGHTGETGGRSDTATGAQHTGDTGALPAGPGPVVLAGGGSEGEVGDPSAWSARLYPHLWDAGDVTGDGLVTVAVLSTAEETAWLPEYFVSLGADAAFNLRVSRRGAADDATLVDTFAAVDAVFIKGGDQGEYYDLWNGTLLEAQIRLVHEGRGGGVGGTSAGAMSMAQHAFAGGEDLVSADILEDAMTPYLDDRDGGSGVHDDFFGFVPGVVIDTHFTARGRLARLIGIMARVVDDGGLTPLVGIGCEEQTGVWIRDGVATVVGVGAVSVVTADGVAPPRRAPRTPLTWTDLRLDRLTDGWRLDLTAGVDVATPPAGAEAVAWGGAGTSGPVGWAADGDRVRHEERFAWVQRRDPDPWSEEPGRDLPVLDDAIGVIDAFDSDRRGPAEEALFRGLHDHIGATGFAIGYGASAERVEGQPAWIQLVDNRFVDEAPMATMLIDTTGVTWRSLSPEPALTDVGDGSLHAAGLVGVVVHVVHTPTSGLGFDTQARAVGSVP
jgi:cyanophycinase